MMFPKKTSYNQLTVLSVLFFSVIGFSFSFTSSVLAAPGVLADTPLFTKNSSQPNVFFEVDDSGSMDFDILTEKHYIGKLVLI